MRGLVIDVKRRKIKIVEDNQKGHSNESSGIIKDKEGYEFCLVDFS